MANSAEYDVIINVITGHLEKATKELKQMGGAVDGVTTSQNKAAKAGKAHNEVMNGGVASANNASRGMSKLLETVGGNNSGLVAAYATLATNAFAVSAAFTTLKSAYQAQQLLQGLEAQGARTGKTLTTVAESVRKLSGEAISAADAMRYTAQASSAGISGKDLERLTKVATASARALGRDAPDSINRLIQAVTKMEPELVDELGLTIKMTEAQQIYARQTGKTATSLSQLEKQQALLNAWASQGEAKFGALAESVDPSPYDQLAASFTNLTNTMLNFVNSIGVVSLVKLLGNDKLALTAALIYLVNTVKAQVLPVFAEASKAAKKLSDERLAGLNKEQENLATLTKTLNDKADKSKKLVGGLTTLTGKGVSVPSGYKEWLNAMRQGIDTTEQFEAAQASLNRSIKLNETFSTQAKTGTIKRGTKSPEEYTAIAEAHKVELADMDKYAIEKKALDAEIMASGKQKILLEREISIITSESAAQGARADAITSLSKGKLKESITSLMIATKQYASALREEIILKAEDAGITDTAAVANTNLNRALVIGKAGWFGAVTGIKAVGAAILEWLPYLGLAVLAWDALLWVIDRLEPDSWKKQAEAYNKLSEVVSSTKDKIEALQKIEASSASVADKGSAALANRVNTLTETVTAYDEYNKVVTEANKSTNSDSNSLSQLALNLVGLSNPLTAATTAWNMWKKSTQDSLGLDNLVKSIYDIGPASSSADKSAASMLASLHKQLPKTTEEFVKANGGLKNLNDEAKNQAIVDYFKKIQPVAESAQKGVQELQGSVTTLNNAYGDFVNSLKISTPYDKLGDSLTGLLTTVSKLRTDLKSKLLNPEDTAKIIADLNASMGSINTGMLSVNTKEAYSNVTAIDKTIQDLRTNQAKVNSTTKEYVSIQNQIAALDKQKEAALVKFSGFAEEDLKILDKQVFQSRLDAISMQASLSLAQARLSVIQRQGILSKQDSDREIDAKNHVIKLQADIQSAQLTYLKGVELQKKLDLDRAIRQAEELTRLQAINDQERERTLIQAQWALKLEESRGKFGQGGTPDVKAIEGYRTLIDKLDKAKDPGAAEKAQQDVETARKEYELFSAQVVAQGKMVEAINLGTVTASEKTAQGAKVNLAVLKETVSLEGARDDAKQKAIENQRLINNLVSKGLTITKNEFDTIRDSYKDKLDKAKESYEFKVKEIEIDKTLAAAQGRTADVKIYQNRLDLLKEEYTINIDNLGVEQRLEVYKKIDLDTQEKKLSLLKQALEVQIAFADQQKTMLDKEQELYKLRAENAVSKHGGTLNETAQKAIESKAAQEQLNLAEKQLALRKIGISLEYDVLEAKRILLKEELKSKKAEADNLAATAKTPVEKAAAEDMSKTLSAAIIGVGQQSYEVLKQNALKLADMDVEILRERATKAYNDLTNLGPKSGLFSSFQDAFNNAKLLKEALIARKSSTTLSEEIIPKPILDRQKELTDAINTNFPELVAQLKKPAEQITTQSNLLQAEKPAISNKRTLDEMLDQGDKNINYKGEFAKRLTGMLNEFFDITKRTSSVKVESGIRSHKKQQELWDKSVSQGHPGTIEWSSGKTTKVAKSGSQHLDDKASAIDLKNNVYNEIVKIPGLLKKWGLQTVANDPNHIQMNKKGKVAIATSSAIPIEPTTTSVSADTAITTAADKGNIVTTKRREEPSAPQVKSTEDVKLSFPEKLAVINEQFFNPILEDFTNLGTQITERLGIDFGPQGKILSALSNFKDQLVSFTQKMSDSWKDLFPKKPILGGIGGPMNTLSSNLTPTTSISTAGSITGGSNVTLAGSTSAISPPLTGGIDNIGSSLSGMPGMPGLTDLGSLKTKSSETAKSVQTDMKTTNTAITEAQTNVDAAQEKTKTGFQKQMGAASVAFSAIAGMIGAVAGLLKSSSDAKLAGIDKEIAAEEKRDGKSAASVAKIDALEKKKDASARKAFNTQKKLMIAQAIMSTAAGVAGALAAPFGLGIPLAIAVGAMGAAEVAIIAGTQYESSYTPKAVSMPTNLSIGKRGDSVDLAKGPNSNAGGEAGYLRGSSGTGSNASNYRTVGSAYGGELMRGYGNRGFVVGEKGPEVITPETPISVTPANDIQGSSPINANFTIQALDSHGVQDILVSQKGNIIKLLREAANASGKTFMEDVNVNVYTRPNVNRL